MLLPPSGRLTPRTCPGCQVSPHPGSSGSVLPTRRRVLVAAVFRRPSPAHEEGPMRNRRPTTARRRWPAALAVLALATPLASCAATTAAASSSTSTAAPARWVSTRSSRPATTRPAGRYTDRRQPAPERRRRPARAVRPAPRGQGLRSRPARHGRHVDGRVRRGRVDPRAHPGAGRAGHRRHPRAAGRHRHVEGQALRHPEAHQRPAALVPQVARARAAGDVGRADGDVPGAEGRRRPVPDRAHRGAVRGLRRQRQQHGQRLRRDAGQRGRDRGDRRRGRRAGPPAAPGARQLRPHQRLAVELAGARGVRRPPGRSRRVRA